MIWFPAKRRAIRTIAITVAAATACYLSGFPMPLALVLGYILAATLAYAWRWT